MLISVVVTDCNFLRLLALVSSVWISSIQDVSSELQEESLAIPSTAKIVNQCPPGKATWTQASNAKNCTVFHPLNYSSPFVYHCLINEWANATVEVCARKINVLFGKCAEYNFGAKRIQSSDRRLCNRTVPPCPNVYNSTDAYKYQSCYEFPSFRKPLEIMHGTNGTNSSVNIPSSQYNAVENIVILISSLGAVVLLCLAVIVSIILVQIRAKNSQNTPQSAEDTNKFINYQ